MLLITLKPRDPSDRGGRLYHWSLMYGLTSAFILVFIFLNICTNDEQLYHKSKQLSIIFLYFVFLCLGDGENFLLFEWQRGRGLCPHLSFNLVANSLLRLSKKAKCYDFRKFTCSKNNYLDARKDMG